MTSTDQKTITGDLAIVLRATGSINDPDCPASVSTNIDKADNTSIFGTLVEIDAHAASASKFGTALRGDLHWTKRGAGLTLASGDKYRKLDLSWMNWLTNWELTYGQDSIDGRALGDLHPVMIPGQTTFSGNLNGFLKEGGGAGRTLPIPSAKGIKIEPLETIKQRFLGGINYTIAAGDTTETTPPTKDNMFEVTREHISLVLMSISPEVGLGKVVMYWIPVAQVGGLTIGSGDFGSRVDMSIPINVQADANALYVRNYNININR